MRRAPADDGSRATGPWFSPLSCSRQSRSPACLLQSSPRTIRIVQPDIVGLKNVAPSLSIPMGTDEASRDVLSRLLYGGRLVANGSALCDSGERHRRHRLRSISWVFDGIGATIIERMLDALLSIPRLLLLIAIFAAWRECHNCASS